MIAHSLPVILIRFPAQPVESNASFYVYVFNNWIKDMCHFSSKLIEGRFPRSLEGRIVICNNSQCVSRTE
jgi:hypothetical protein